MLDDFRDFLKETGIITFIIIIIVKGGEYTEQQRLVTLAQLLPLQGESPVILLLHNIRDGCTYTINKERTPSELSMEKSGEQSGIILCAIFLSESARSG